MKKISCTQQFTNNFIIVTRVGNRFPKPDLSLSYLRCALRHDACMTELDFPRKPLDEQELNQRDSDTPVPENLALFTSLL